MKGGTGHGTILPKKLRPRRPARLRFLHCLLLSSIVSGKYPVAGRMEVSHAQLSREKEIDPGIHHNFACTCRRLGYLGGEAACSLKE